MQKRSLSYLGLGALGLILAASLAGCGEQPTNTDNSSTSTQATTMTESSQASNTIVVGGVLPLTGDGAAYGEPMQKVANIALDEINANGGVNGKKLQINWEDGKCDGADATTAINKLIDVDKVQIVDGGFCSSETLAMAPIAERSHVVVLSPGSSSPDITNAGDYIFRNYPSDATQGKVLAGEAIKRGYKKIAVIVEQNDYTLGIKKAFDQNYSQSGTLDVQTYLPDDTDFRTALLKLKSGKPDALFIIPQTPAKADLIFKQFEDMKWKVPLIADDVVAGYPDLITKYAKTVEGMLVAEFSYDKSNPDFAKLQATFKAQTGKDMPYGGYAATVYDSIYIIKEAIAKVGNNADAIKAYLYAIKDRKGLAGSLTFDENGDPISGHSLEIVKAGKVVAYSGK